MKKLLIFGMLFAVLLGNCTAFAMTVDEAFAAVIALSYTSGLIYQPDIQNPEPCRLALGARTGLYSSEASIGYWFGNSIYGLEINSYSLHFEESTNFGLLANMIITSSDIASVYVSGGVIPDKNDLLLAARVGIEFMRKRINGVGYTLQAGFPGLVYLGCFFNIPF
ncbi:MAG: hypothetical protein KKH83_05930 [Candidatus Margulisbacteria bacterium]|nr:hypothetical protein [Candidatus Margulisiibacteriota bacterium]